MIKINFKLYPINEQVKPYETPFGHLFQAVIFGWLHENCPKLTHQLHAYEQVRPYAINCHIHKNKPLVEFTIVSYDKPLSSVLIETVKPIDGKILKVADKKYRVRNLQIEKIYLEKLIHNSKPVRNFHIHFPTPIHFSTAKGNYPVRFPLPSMIFGNLSKIWNDMIQQTAQIERQDFLNWVNAHCYVSGYEMRSAKYFIKSDQKVAGGHGSMSYRIKKPNKSFYEKFKPPNILKNPKTKSENKLTIENKQEQVKAHYRSNCRWVDLLCRVGEYTNVGRNRTAGMGVIRYFPKNYIEKQPAPKVLSSIT